MALHYSQVPPPPQCDVRSRELRLRLASDIAGV